MIYLHNISIKHLLISVIMIAFIFFGANNSFAQQIDNKIETEVIKTHKSDNLKTNYEIEKQIEQNQNYKEGEHKTELHNDEFNRQIIAGFILLVIILFYIGYRTYLKYKELLLEIYKSHDLLKIKDKYIEQKNTEIEYQNKEILVAHEQIKNIQDQLIESQRLAALGQITAGIAHEIRNPLNFVTNFSTLIVELIDDLNEIVGKEINIPPSDEFEEVKDILAMISSNAEKINLHGERASTIITNMLDVSRMNNNNVYTLEAFNNVVRDSAKLAFEGAKGNMPGFDVHLKFDFDENIKNIPILKQDLSRVFINMISNSCQAIESKLEGDKDFFGEIKITTKLIEDKVQIIINDNGTGISDKVKDNIFTPFFTTKESGKGTGLGLTMTYDIITKLHKGRITVDSKEGEFTTFTIEIPTNLNS